MELKEGMYVRNNHFGIGKINKEYFDGNNKHWFNVQFNCYEDEDCHCGICEETIGFKASYNIIDLIEVGDYVNGVRVCLADEEYGILGENDVFYKEQDIKSIVTKEQFYQISYNLPKDK